MSTERNTETQNQPDATAESAAGQEDPKREALGAEETEATNVPAWDGNPSPRSKRPRSAKAL